MMLDEGRLTQGKIIYRDLYEYYVHHMNFFKITRLVYLNNF